MVKPLPPEVTARIAAFEAEELARKKAKAPNGESKKERQLRETITSGTVFKPSELLKFATSNGWEIIGQEGSHRKLEDRDGNILIIPANGGQQETVQPDTNQRILQKIFPNYFSNKK